MTLARTVFMIDPHALRDLNAVEGTRLIADLIRCEATERGLPAKRIVISMKTTAKDGGVDAKVEDVPAGGSLLLEGISYFQIKTGETFKPWKLGDLKKELLGSRNARPDKAHLGTEVRRCLEKKGNYFLVTLGHDLLPTQHTDAAEHLKALFADCGYKNAKTDALGQGQIVGHLQRFPSLCLTFNGLGESSFQSIDSWRSNSDMQASLALADAQKRFIEEIREAWRGSQYQHIRVIGEPGIGKTRLLLEAALADDLKAPTIYIPHAEEFQRSTLFNELLKPDRSYTVNLVIDECEERDRAPIWSALKGRPRIKLITIDHGPELSSDVAMKVLLCPSLPDEQIGEILAAYIGHRLDLSKWTTWCEGSPRVAHAVGENLKHNPQDVLKSPATVPIWDRFIIGHQKLDSKSAGEHRLVLQHIALFQRFGFEEPVSHEAQFISTLVAEAEPSITWARFQRIVRHHADRRILQGRHTLFIVPKALHVHLWLGYWREYGVGFDFDGFMSRLPKEMSHWFLQLFIYAHAAPVAKGVVKRILTLPTGPFGRRDFLISRLGTRFLSYLAEADASATLSVIERTFGQWRLEDLRGWNDGRQSIVLALEKIAVWSDLFARSAKVLCRLALAENTSFSNNSKGTFVGLFSIGPGWAATAATPELRFPILSHLVQSSDTAERSLGLELCERWLSPHGGSRIVGAEYQGMRPTLSFWGPETHGEWHECWRRVWRFLRSEVKTWSDAERRVGANRLISSGAALLPYEPMATEVMETFEALVDDSAIDKAHFVETVIRVTKLRYQKLPAGILRRAMRLDKKLTGTSFESRFSRFVLYTTWDEYYTLNNNEIEPNKAAAARIVRLAKEALRSKSLLKKHLPRFISSEGYRLHEFGVQVGKLAEASLDNEIVETLEADPSAAKSDFIGAYLFGVRQKDYARWEANILRMLEAPGLSAVGANASLRSGISERVARRLLRLYKNGVIDARVLTGFGFYAKSGDMPPRVVDEAIAAMLERGEEADLTASVELLDDHYCREARNGLLPKELAFRALCNTLSSDMERDTMREYRWHRVATKYRETYPEKDLELLSEMLPRFDRIYRLGHPHEPANIADQIAKAYPKEAWKIVSVAIMRSKRTAFDVVQWLGDGGSQSHPDLGVLRFLDADDVISWIEEARDERLPLLISALPKTLNPTDGGLLTQRFIEKFGEIENVSEDLARKFMYTGWRRGRESDYLSLRRDSARYWLSEIKSPQVENWLLRYIEMLSETIERAKIREERE